MLDLNEIASLPRFETSESTVVDYNILRPMNEEPLVPSQASSSHASSSVCYLPALIIGTDDSGSRKVPVRRYSSEIAKAETLTPGP